MEVLNFLQYSAAAVALSSIAYLTYKLSSHSNQEISKRIESDTLIAINEQIKEMEENMELISEKHLSLDDIVNKPCKEIKVNYICSYKK